MKEIQGQQRAAFVKQLKSTRIYTSKPNAMTFDEWLSIVTIGYVGMVGDLFHSGHLNILHSGKGYYQLVLVWFLGDGCEIATGSVDTRSIKPFAIMWDSPTVNIGLRQDGDEAKSLNIREHTKSWWIAYLINCQKQICCCEYRICYLFL